jgi:hypothetical protein
MGESGMIDTTYRFPQFGIGNSVGELQGEMQRPPESLRKGRMCMLLDYPITDDAVLDKTALKFVEYLEPRKVEQYLFNDNFSVFVEDDDEDYDTSMEIE